LHDDDSCERACVDWIEHKVKGNRYDAQRWTRKKRCRKRRDIRSDVIIGGGKNEMEGQKKKIPTPRRGVSLFFRVRGEQGPLQTTTVVLSAQ
jgi:hypothetical protein